MNVEDIMSRDIACVTADDSIAQAALLMKRRDVGSLPVCDNQQVIGIVTDRDIALRSVAENQNPANQNVRDVMSINPAIGNPQMDVHDAARIMSEQQIRRLPIVDNNQLVGIVSLGDLSVQPELQDNAEWALKNISEPPGSQME